MVTFNDGSTFDQLAIRLSKVKEQARFLSYDFVETISDREVSLWARET
jgi:hypothetical protein